MTSIAGIPAASAASSQGSYEDLTALFSDSSGPRSVTALRTTRRRPSLASTRS
jgi:hypothetical protein